ncbi:MAG: hypothetical protein PSX81_13495 [bacterium]|nr:hypothetical protein [bacterium]
MKVGICYIFLSGGLKSDSVQKKVISQIKGLINSGVVCRGLFFTEDVNKETDLDENIKLIPYPITNRRFLNIIYQKRALLNYVLKYLLDNINKNELIYLRYPGCSYELFKFARKFKNRIISEHQAIEIAEIKSLKNEHPLALNINKLISYFLYQFWPIYNELIWSKPYSKMLFAKVAVTNEIAIYHKKHCKSVWVIPNGIDTANYKVRISPSLEDKIKIIFLKGTTGNAPWNGIDRLVNSIDNYHGKEKLELIICGNIIEGEVPVRNYINQTGYMNSEELDRLISTVHFGFSTLCLFRKNLNEAAVLKAREYFARGLPFAYGYTDPDLSTLEIAKKYCFKVENNDSILNLNLIINFIKEVYADPMHTIAMRKIAEEKLDWNVKMKKIKDHILHQFN